MSRLASLAFLILCSVVVSPSSLDAQGTSDRSILVSLQSRDSATRQQAVAAALRIPYTQRSPSLAKALAAEFTQVVAEDVLRRKKGMPSSEADGDYLGDLLEANVYSDDETLIPAFIGVLDSGAMAQSALSRYGEPAAVRVLAVLENESAAPETVLGAVRSLNLMFRAPVRKPLSTTSKRRSIEAAKKMLDSPRRAGELGVLSVIDLAIATNEPALRAVVEEIAKEPSAVLARGVPARMVDLVRRQASAALVASRGR